MLLQQGQQYAVQNQPEAPVKTVSMMVKRLDLFIERLTKLYAQVDNISVRLNGHAPIPNEIQEAQPIPTGLTWELDAKLDTIAKAILGLEAAVQRAETAVG